MLEHIASQSLALLAETALKSLALFAVLGLLLLALRRAKATVRHLLCLTTLAGMLLLPVLSATLPGWNGIRMPQWQDAKVGFQQRQIRTPRSQPHVSLPDGAVQPIPSAPRVTPRDAGNAIRTLTLFRQPSITIFLFWLLGLSGVFIRLVLGWIEVVRIRHACHCISKSELCALLEGIPTRAYPRRSLTIRYGMAEGYPSVPMTWGWAHPVIVLPWDAEEWPAERLQIVLLHELAHIRRNDWATQTLTQLICALFWFHPLVWLTFRHLCLESERASDDEVLNSGVMASTYATHLIDIVRSVRRPLRTTVAMGHFAQLEDRLKTILAPRADRRWRVLVTAAAFCWVLLVLVFVSGLHPATSQTVPPVVSSARHSDTAEPTPMVLPADVPAARPTKRNIGTPEPQHIAAVAPVLTVRNTVPAPPTTVASHRRQPDTQAPPPDSDDREMADPPDPPDVPDAPETPGKSDKSDGVVLNISDSNTFSEAISKVVLHQVRHALKQADKELEKAQRILKQTRRESSINVDQIVRDATRTADKAVSDALQHEQGSH